MELTAEFVITSAIQLEIAVHVESKFVGFKFNVTSTIFFCIGAKDCRNYR